MLFCFQAIGSDIGGRRTVEVHEFLVRQTETVVDGGVGGRRVPGETAKVMADIGILQGTHCRAALAAARHADRWAEKLLRWLEGHPAG
jgi:hypothetical protein